MSNIIMNVFLLTSLFNFLPSYASYDCPYVNQNYLNDRREDNSKLRLVQFNAEWLFIDYYSPSNCPGNGCSWTTLDDANYHMSLISNIITELNPDIINICEVESCNELNMLIDEIDMNKDVNATNTYNPYLIKGTDTSTGQNVGMITKIDPIVNLYRSEEKITYPIEGTKCGNTSVYGTTGVSKHYITEFSLNLESSEKMNVALIGAHLLAIPTDPSRCVQREAQAQVLQNIIHTYFLKNFEVIVMGDMNDYDMETLDMNSNKPTSRVLNIIKGIEGDKAGTYSLTNSAHKLDQKERYSDWYDSDNNCDTMSNKDYSMIDHILVSKLLESRIKDVFIYHSYSEYCGKMNSDHYPVVVDFLL